MVPKPEEVKRVKQCMWQYVSDFFKLSLNTQYRRDSHFRYKLDYSLLMPKGGRFREQLFMDESSTARLKLKNKISMEICFHIAKIETIYEMG